VIRGARVAAEPDGADRHELDDGGEQRHGLDPSAMHWTRPERANGVSTVQGGRIFVAKRVKRIVLRVLPTGV